MSRGPRVAFFTDTFDEINGVALTSRQLTDFARRQERPFLCVRGGAETKRSETGSVSHLELCRGPLAFELDRGLLHDPTLWRLHGQVEECVEDFRPDIIHVVSPGDVSGIGVYVAKTMKLPLAVSWHTNLHEFGAMRLDRLLGWMADEARQSIVDFSQTNILNAVIAFYKLGDVLFAPNDELVRMLAERTEKPVFLMKRGIDTELFHPSRRTVSDDVLRLGFVGRVTPEKSVRFLRELEEKLSMAGVPAFRLVVIGDGSEREWLRENLAAADLPGIQRGEELARWYANMDVFVFPSRTDTFGNVVGGICVGGAGGGDRCGRAEVHSTAGGIGVRGAEQCGVCRKDSAVVAGIRQCGGGWRRQRVRRPAGSRGIRYLRRCMRVTRLGWHTTGVSGSVRIRFDLENR